MGACNGGAKGSAREMEGLQRGIRGDLCRRSGGLQERSGGLQQGRRGARAVAAPSRGSHLLPGGSSQGLLQELPEPRVRRGGRDGAEGQGDGDQGQGALEAARQHLAGGSGAERRRRRVGAGGSAAARLRRWGSPRLPSPL